MGFDMGYAAIFIPLVLLLLFGLLVVGCWRACRNLLQRKPPLFQVHLVIVLAVSGWVAHGMWTFWRGFWSYMNCSSC